MIFHAVGTRACSIRSFPHTAVTWGQDMLRHKSRPLVMRPTTGACDRHHLQSPLKPLLIPARTIRQHERMIHPKCHRHRDADDPLAVQRLAAAALPIADDAAVNLPHA
jgi:hypothetical protein